MIRTGTANMKLIIICNIEKTISPIDEKGLML